MQTKPQSREHADDASEQLEDLLVADTDAGQTTGGSGSVKRETIEIASWSFGASNPTS